MHLRAKVINSNGRIIQKKILNYYNYLVIVAYKLSISLPPAVVGFQRFPGANPGFVVRGGREWTRGLGTAVPG